MSAVETHEPHGGPPDSPIWTLGDRIWKARKNLGWEQSEVAELCEVSRSLVSRWERDLSVPDAKQIRKLADAAGVSVEWLTASPCFWPLPSIEGQMELALGVEPPSLEVASHAA